MRRTAGREFSKASGACYGYSCIVTTETYALRPYPVRWRPVILLRASASLAPGGGEDKLWS